MNLTTLLPVLEPLDLRSCLISYRGKRIIEHYRNERTETELAKINSCTKSILSALICIAMDKQLLPGPDELAATFFPQLAHASDVRKREITIEQLLTMTAGLNWTEFGGQQSFPRMTRTGNWIDFVLEQPLADLPGQRMEYNSGLSQMLATMLVQASGISCAQFADRWLFGPLGITQYEWEQDPQGVHTGGFGMRMRPVDMLKFGELYMYKGRWNQEQLISAELVARSTAPAIDAEPPRRGRYGWHWWTDHYDGRQDGSEAEAHGRQPASFHYFHAYGYGGQNIVIVPELELVVVISNDRMKRGKAPFDVFRQFIAPVIATEYTSATMPRDG